MTIRKAYAKVSDTIVIQYEMMMFWMKSNRLPASRVNLGAYGCTSLTVHFTILIHLLS
jgi:hypothetical protein